MLGKLSQTEHLQLLPADMICLMTFGLATALSTWISVMVAWSDMVTQGTGGESIRDIINCSRMNVCDGAEWNDSIWDHRHGVVAQSQGTSFTCRMCQV